MQANALGTININDAFYEVIAEGGCIILSVFGELLFGIGMCLSMVFGKMILGIVIGLVGIITLLMLISLTVGLK